MTRPSGREPADAQRGLGRRWSTKPPRGDLYALLDSTPLCHIACADSAGLFITPTLFWREGERLYWHGSPGSRLIRAAQDQAVSIAVTRFDALVLTRSAFHHSANYASALVTGIAARTPDEDKKAHLQRLMETLFPHRSKLVRPPSPSELKATVVLSVALGQSSIKSRTGGVIEDAADHARKVWAGLVELAPTYAFVQDAEQAASCEGLPKPSLTPKAIGSQKRLRNP
jgi:nitroimidazol reductase NimA-like FMN-containing flavoprotein (pyridoxamine 5'-phosphate oxidase superfamily)